MEYTLNKIIRVGTRRSALAIVQTEWVIEQLKRFHPQLKTAIVEVVTKGDRFLQTSLDKIEGKGVFVKEIEEMLLSGEIDLAVHSMKDLPTELPDGLTIGAIPRRADPHDVLITPLNKNLNELPAGIRVGTSSLRRKAQLLAFRPDLNIVDIRGNLDTRLRKVEKGDYDAVVLAAAGLARMGWLSRVQEYLQYEIMLPAPGQGALAIEIRAEDTSIRELMKPIHDPLTAMAVQVERHALTVMGGGCHTPFAALCQIQNEQAAIYMFMSDPQGQIFLREKISGKVEEAVQMAEQLALNFKNRLKIK
ncbi:MAG: hydroxymethylbilane synthase [Calditrichaeota bacterium]|nr:MAG: hydroxymethylbilane synthase [Calditrichota bacterium]